MGILSPDIDAAMSAEFPVLFPFVMWAGLFVNIDDVPDWLPWKWLSPFRYAFEALIRNEYDNLSDMSHHLRHKAVDDLNFSYNYWEDIWILVILFIGFRFLAGLAFVGKNKNN